MTGGYKATPKQLRAIYAISRKLGMDDEDIHGLAYRMAQVESLLCLTRREAGRMIDFLMRRAGQEPQPLTGRATKAQRWMIDTLARELGWGDSPERLRGFMRRMCGADDIRFITPAQASKLIESMKAMRKGGRGVDRRKEEGDACDSELGKGCADRGHQESHVG